MAELSSDAWTCSICLELAYKPCVNSCGHVFCFWCGPAREILSDLFEGPGPPNRCMHRAMNMFDSSKCPLCRDPYSYFPWICEKLHSFLSVAFVDEYQDRAKATLEEEKDNQAFSPELPEVETSGGGSILSFAKEHFKCSKPSCRELMYRPTVLNCGHMLCGDTCARDSEGLPVTKCPACCSPAMGKHGICQPVHEFLLSNFPAEQAEKAAAVASRRVTTSSEGRGGGAGAPPAGKPDDRTTEAGGEGSSATGLGHASSSDRDGQAEMLSPFFGIERLRDICENFVHHGAGCDHCGQYPIVGERFICVECSRDERMGYDLCGDCMKSGTEIFRGRFNQGHTPDHEMKKVNNSPNVIHMFQALNPDLPLAQLISLLQMQTSPLDDAEAGPGQGAVDQSEAMEQLSRDLDRMLDPYIPDLVDNGGLLDLLENPEPERPLGNGEQTGPEASGEAEPQESIRFPFFRRIRQRLARRRTDPGPQG